MRTSKGYQIAWLTKCTYQVQGFEGYSGRVRVVLGDPSQDEVVRWDSGHNSINHDYGQLVSTKGSNSDTVSGFNFFDGLARAKLD